MSKFLNVQSKQIDDDFTGMKVTDQNCQEHVRLTRNLKNCLQKEQQQSRLSA